MEIARFRSCFSYRRRNSTVAFGRTNALLPYSPSCVQPLSKHRDVAANSEHNRCPPSEAITVCYLAADVCARTKGISHSAYRSVSQFEIWRVDYRRLPEPGRPPDTGLTLLFFGRYFFRFVASFFTCRRYCALAFSSGVVLIFPMAVPDSGSNIAKSS